MKDIFIVMHAGPMWRKDGNDTQLHVYAVDPNVLSVFSSYEKAVEYIESIHPEYKKYGTVWTTPVRDLPGSSGWQTHGKIWIKGEFILKE